MFLDEDDEYYDDDDEYYDDDAEEEGGGSGALVVVLVALIVVLGVGALGAGAWLLFGDAGDAGPVAGATPADAPPVAGSTPAPLDTGMDDLPELDDPIALAGPDDPTAVAPSEEPAEDPTPEAVRSHYRDPETNSERRLTVRGGSSSRSDGSSSRASSGSRSGSSSRRTSGSSGSRSAAGSGTGRSSSGGASSSSGSRRSSNSAQPSTTPDSASSEDTPEEGAVIEDQPRQAKDLELRYEEDVLASLKTKAVAGSLSDDQRDFLEAVPDDNPLFTEVLAIAMRDAEAKRDWKGHCSMTNRIIKKLENRYQPEWNLELAKCRLRNADYEGAVDAIDRTLSDSMGMTRSTKVRRLMLAYEIKAVARTRIYDNQARANSGMGDDALLNNAISSWTEYRDYAAGIGDGRATQKADREIADLVARKGS